MTAETVGADVDVPAGLIAMTDEEWRRVWVAAGNGLGRLGHASQEFDRILAARTADHAAALRAADAAGFIRGYGKGCESAAAVLTSVRALAEELCDFDSGHGDFLTTGKSPTAAPAPPATSEAGA